MKKIGMTLGVDLVGMRLHESILPQHTNGSSRTSCTECRRMDRWDAPDSGHGPQRTAPEQIRMGCPQPL